MKKGFEFRHLAAILIGIFFLTGIASIAWAEYPERPITINVPWSPGGGTDRTARALAAGDLRVDVAFIAAPTADDYGNCNGAFGDAAFGAMGAMILALMHKRLNVDNLAQSVRATLRMTSMVFMILVGATAFGLVFRGLGGDGLVREIMTSLPGEAWGFLAASMLLIFLLGFFLDFLEICFIVVPVLAPIADSLGIDLLWFAVLIAVNLQTSFLTPPFGFALFYLKAAAGQVRCCRCHKVFNALKRLAESPVSLTNSSQLHMQHAAFQIEGRFQCRKQLFTQAGDVLSIFDTLDQDGEFVTAQAGDRIAATDGRAQTLGGGT